MLTPLHWVFHGPLALAWVTGAAVVFPVLKRLKLWEGPNELSFTGNDMRDKVVIVTGANTGIGRATAMNIAKMGATILLACRSPERAEAARQEMTAELREVDKGHRYDFPFASKGSFVCLPLDLSSLASVQSFAKLFKKKYKRLDALVCNAGLANGSGASTEGLEIHMATNYLGHFALIKALLDTLKSTKGSRIVNVSSLMHEFACLDWEGSFAGHYRSWKDRVLGSHYNDSKLAMVLMTLQLRHRLKGTTVRAVAVSPGAVSSDIWRRWGKWYRRLVLDPACALLFLSNEQGSHPSVFAATTAELPEEDEEDEDDVLYYHPYYSPSSRVLLPFEVMGPFNGWTVAKPRLPRQAKKAAEDLWWLSEKLLMQHAEDPVAM